MEKEKLAEKNLVEKYDLHTANVAIMRLMRISEQLPKGQLWDIEQLAARASLLDVGICEDALDVLVYAGIFLRKGAHYSVR